jgi:hypothetical protein
MLYEIKDDPDKNSRMETAKYFTKASKMDENFSLRSDDEYSKTLNELNIKEYTWFLE